MKVDHKGPTVTLIRNENNDNLFGGYTSMPYTSQEYTWVRDEKAFLFSITKGRKYEQGFHSVNNSSSRQDADKAVYHHKNAIVAFGAGHDLFISNDSNKNSNSYCNISTTFAASLSR